MNYPLSSKPSFNELLKEECKGALGEFKSSVLHGGRLYTHKPSSKNAYDIVKEKTIKILKEYKVAIEQSSTMLSAELGVDYRAITARTIQQNLDGINEVVSSLLERVESVTEASSLSSILDGVGIVDSGLMVFRGILKEHEEVCERLEALKIYRERAESVLEKVNDHRHDMTSSGASQLEGGVQEVLKEIDSIEKALTADQKDKQELSAESIHWDPQPLWDLIERMRNVRYHLEALESHLDISLGLEEEPPYSLPLRGFDASSRESSVEADYGDHGSESSHGTEVSFTSEAESRTNSQLTTPAVTPRKNEEAEVGQSHISASDAGLVSKAVSEQIWDLNDEAFAKLKLSIFKNLSEEDVSKITVDQLKKMSYAQIFAIAKEKWELTSDEVRGCLPPKCRSFMQLKFPTKLKVFSMQVLVGVVFAGIMLTYFFGTLLSLPLYLIPTKSEKLIQFRRACWRRSVVVLRNFKSWILGEKRVDVSPNPKV